MVFLKCAACILWYTNALFPVLSLVYIRMAIVMNVNKSVVCCMVVMNVNNLLFAAWWS